MITASLNNYDEKEEQRATLFSAIESGDERIIADILRRIVTVARKDGWSADDIIRFLCDKGIEPGGNLRGWIRYQVAALDEASASSGEPYFPMQN